MRPLLARGCDATAYFYAGIAYSRLNRYAATAQLLSKALLDCRPGLRPHHVSTARDTLDWAINEHARAISHTIHATVSVEGAGADNDTFAMRAEAERDPWRRLVERLRARMPGVDWGPASPSAAHPAPGDMVHCPVPTDPMGCRPVPAPAADLGSDTEPQ
ncbi:MAG TPA: hypothetical protein VGW40_00090 [Allosphingosinicella sp.]|nr:hypothetical protein [Allosphingosinicella sp.]